MKPMQDLSTPLRRRRLCAWVIPLVLLCGQPMNVAAQAAGLKTVITVNDYTRAHDFRGAAMVLDHLGEIVGYTTAEEVLDTIFGEFCIGK